MSALTDLFDSFLRALSDPEGGAELYGLHTSAAPMRHAGGIAAASQIDPAAFASTHRDLSHQGQGRLPRFVSPQLLETHPSAAGAGENVTWFSITESSASLTLFLALGTQSTVAGTRIGWCTLAERVLPWTYRQGLLQTLADYPWMRKAEPVACRALVDASYFRQHWRPALRLRSLPDARFSCRMSSACCRHDYEITLPTEAQLLIDAIPWRQIRPQLTDTQLAVRPDGQLQLKTAQEKCRFLGPTGLCSIHQVLGRQPFAACCVFPFSFAHTPEGLAIGLSPICGSTRSGSGISVLERENDVRERLIHAEPRSTDAYRLGPEMAVSWEQFRDIEKTLCDCLAATDLPMRRRLYIGTKLLSAMRQNQPIALQAWVAEPISPLLPDLRVAIRGMLERVLTWDREVLRALPRDLPADLHLRESNDAAVVVRILQNTLFCKVYSYAFDLTTAYNFLIVLYLLTLTMEAANDGRVSSAMWRELGSLGVHGLLKSLLHEHVPDDFRKVFGTPEFGMWMLAA